MTSEKDLWSRGRRRRINDELDLAASTTTRFFQDREEIGVK
jgi:hypothetical protein